MERPRVNKPQAPGGTARTGYGRTLDSLSPAQRRRTKKRIAGGSVLRADGTVGRRPKKRTSRRKDAKSGNPDAATKSGKADA